MRATKGPAEPKFTALLIAPLLLLPEDLPEVDEEEEGEGEEELDEERAGVGVGVGTSGFVVLVMVVELVDDLEEEEDELLESDDEREELSGKLVELVEFKQVATASGR